MPSASLQDFFTRQKPPPIPAPDLATEASFSIPDIERLLRENKAMRAKLRDIGDLVEQWVAVRAALRHG